MIALFLGESNAERSVTDVSAAELLNPLLSPLLLSLFSPSELDAVPLVIRRATATVASIAERRFRGCGTAVALRYLVHFFVLPSLTQSRLVTEPDRALSAGKLRSNGGMGTMGSSLKAEMARTLFKRAVATFQRVLAILPDRLFGTNAGLFEAQLLELGLGGSMTSEEVAEVAAAAGAFVSGTAETSDVKSFVFAKCSAGEESYGWKLSWLELSRGRLSICGAGAGPKERIDLLSPRRRSSETSEAESGAERERSSGDGGKEEALSLSARSAAEVLRVRLDSTISLSTAPFVSNGGVAEETVEIVVQPRHVERHFLTPDERRSDGLEEVEVSLRLDHARSTTSLRKLEECVEQAAMQQCLQRLREGKEELTEGQHRGLSHSVSRCLHATMEGEGDEPSRSLMTEGPNWLRMDMDGLSVYDLALRELVEEEKRERRRTEREGERDGEGEEEEEEDEYFSLEMVAVVVPVPLEVAEAVRDQLDQIYTGDKEDGSEFHGIVNVSHRLLQSVEREIRSLSKAVKALSSARSGDRRLSKKRCEAGRSLKCLYRLRDELSQL